MEKISRIITLMTALMLCSFFFYGQQLKTFTKNNYETSDGNSGTLTYMYYEDSFGNYIMHGKYSYNGSLDVSGWNSVERTHQKIHTQHSTNATFKDGWLDGTVTITKKTTKESTRSKYFKVMTETVNFKNGVPHGLWKIVKTEDKETSTLISMTFTDGMLTGQFQWQDQTGQFDSKGRYSGKWTERDYQTYIEHNFINGVEVSVIKRKDGIVIEKTPDEDIATATKFANGEISESELESMKYILKESSGLFSTNKPTTPFYLNNFDLGEISGDKTLEIDDYEKTLGKPYLYLKKINYDILPDHMFNCILVDLGLMKTCKNYKPVLEKYQDMYSIKGCEDALFINRVGKTYYMTHEQREKLDQCVQEKVLENANSKAAEKTLVDLYALSQLFVEKEINQEFISSVLAEKGLPESASSFLPIVYFSVDSSMIINKGKTTVFCTLVKKIDDTKAPYQTWKTSFLFEDNKFVEKATLNFNEAQRVIGPFEAIMEIRNTIKKEESVIMSLEKECPYFVKTYTSNKKEMESRIADLEKLTEQQYETPESIKETYEKRIMPLTKSFSNLARQYKSIKASHDEIMEKTKYYTDIQKSYLKKVGEEPYDMGDRQYHYNTNYQYVYDHTDYYFTKLNPNDTNKLKDKYINVPVAQRDYLNMLNAIDIRDKNTRKIQDDPDEACKDVISWYKKNKKNFDQSLSGSISDITKKTRALVNFQNTILKFMEKRKYISKQNELITMNAGEFAKDVDKAYQAYAKNHDISITADTVESFKRLQQFSTIQDTCLAFIAHRKLIADNDAQIIDKGKNCKNITKAYSTYMKSADLAWTPELNCCNKLCKVVDIQNQFLTAVKSPNASELDAKIKKLKDKSLENVLKELK